jgi:tetratricopeptide (TPR) repeat protein
MFEKKILSDYGRRLRRKQIVRTVIPAVFIVILLSVSVPLLLGSSDKFGDERKTLKNLWENGSYKETFEISKQMLSDMPMDYNMLIVYGFSAYQLALGQITEADKDSWVDACIESLRKALLVKSSVMDGPIYYVLGKAYFSKGPDYAELAVKFLETAQKTSYSSPDMFECLGLAYAAIHQYRSSVQAFSSALNVQEDAELVSAQLLLAIAKSYIELEDFERATEYLNRCIVTSKDYKMVVRVRLDLGSIFFKQGDFSASEDQYQIILKDTGENADARFQLGEIYAAKNDPIRARAEWRKAIRIDPVHAPTRQRLSLR